MNEALSACNLVGIDPGEPARKVREVIGSRFNGNYINAEMVKAFLSSIEYRQRFGP
jgi:hypothetical protein